MARTALNYNLGTKSARAKLAPRQDPYYMQIATGKTLGYRRRNAGAIGTWTVRKKIGGRFKWRGLGQADDVARADGRDVLTFDQALRLATGAQPTAGPVGRLTVRKAMDAYLTALGGRSKHAKEYRSASDKHILPTLGDLRVDHLTKTQIEAWQVGLVREDDPDDPEAKRRSQDTANRILTHLKAGLNAAFQDEANGLLTDAAWRRVKPFRDVARAREDDLEAKQVRLLIAKAATFDEALAWLIEAGYLTGARMGELAAASVCDLDVKRRTLRLDGKTGQRVVSLTAEGAEFFRLRAVGRDRDAALLPRSDGTRWPRSAHQRFVTRALALAELPSSASFYTLRHAHISRAIENGQPLQLVADNCGTSLMMIQKNYAKVLARTRRDVIEKTSPKLRRVK